MPTSWRPGIQLIILNLLISIGNSQFYAGNGNGCDRYVNCRNDLLELYWKCSEPSRRFTQHACKVNKLYGEHKTTSYNIESMFSSCTSRFSAINEIDQLVETESNCNLFSDNDATISYSNLRNCWSNLMRLTQKCFAMSRCCPSAQRCTREIENDVISEQFESEKNTMKELLEECHVDMDAVLRTPISRDDATIARKVSKAAKKMLKTVVPFRIFHNTKKTRNPESRQFGTPALLRVRNGRRPVKFHKYGISKSKYTTTVRTTKDIEPPTSSLRPFTVLHTGDTIESTSKPPGFTPFTYKPVDFGTSVKRNRGRKNKKLRRHRKKKHDFQNSWNLQRATTTNRMGFNSLNAARKLDKLSGLVKSKGEYGRSILPKMLLVKQNKGKFLGYAHPVAKPIQTDLPQTVEDIYDDIVESQVDEITNRPIASTNPPTDPPTQEAFINNNGAWTMEPPAVAEEVTTTPLSVAPIITTTHSPPMILPIGADPLIDYVTHELLDKHMEKPRSEEDLDFSNADYIDISAMDIEPTSITPITPFPPSNYENQNTRQWKLQTRTTTPPIDPQNVQIGEQEETIPVPPSADQFRSIGVTPSSDVFTTPLDDNQLWPIPIQRKRKRMRMMSAKTLEHEKPIVILPLEKPNRNQSEKHRRKLTSGCQRYEKCLRRDVEWRMKCAKPYPTPFDKCSAQLLPLYRLIDEASNNKLQFFIQCIEKSKEQNSKCSPVRTITEEEINCNNLEKWSSYCKNLEKCCPARDQCNTEAEVDHVGTRLKLLEKSFSLRAAACQFKHAFHRSLVNHS